MRFDVRSCIEITLVCSVMSTLSSDMMLICRCRWLMSFSLLSSASDDNSLDVVNKFAGPTVPVIVFFLLL